MGKIVLLLFAVVVGGNALSMSVIQTRLPFMEPKRDNLDDVDEIDDTDEVEPRASCRCGINNKVFRIIGGNCAGPDEYPWMAALCYKDSCTYLSYFCGGSLINYQYILTAAHCLQNKAAADITVHLGDHRLFYYGRPSPAEYRAIKIISHKKYDSRTLRNDIALIKLKDKVEISNKIRPVCLPPPKKAYEEKTAYLTGWGDTSNKGTYAETLNEVALKVIPRKECVKAFSEHPGSIFIKMFCATARRSNGCNSDSGGPFVYNANGYYEQIGVAIGGMDCTDFRFPAVFTTVNLYLNFIRKNTKDAEYCTKSTE